jgi:hypothetical protein
VQEGNILMVNSKSRNNFLSNLGPLPAGEPLQTAWSPTLEAERVEFLNILKQYAAQIPHENGLKAWIAYRDMIGQLFPGNMPAPAALAILTVVAANAVSSLCEQMEGGIIAEDPAIRGRREAIANLFADILNAAVQERLRLRLQSLSNSVN